MQRLICAVFCVTVLFVQSRATLANAPFKKALQKEYDFKSVSCYTCHTRKADIAAEDLDAFKENSKAFRNSFGEQLAKLLEGKGLTKRLKDVKKLKSDDPKKKQVTEEVTKEFLEALKAVTSVKSPAGATYGELLKQGTLDGVKPR